LATIAGVLVGGWAVNRLGILRSLFTFALLQGISNLSFMVVALLGKQYGAMIVATVIENFCGGTATAEFLAFLMSLCDRQFTATQYALLSSLFAFGGTLVGSWSGFVAQLGWVPFWGLTSLGALPGMILLPLIRPHSSRH
jgi:PAT family beta-lactamase induction signal transducer AmpG